MQSVRFRQEHLQPLGASIRWRGRDGGAAAGYDRVSSSPSPALASCRVGTNSRERKQMRLVESPFPNKSSLGYNPGFGPGSNRTQGAVLREASSWVQLWSQKLASTRTCFIHPTRSPRYGDQLYLRPQLGQTHDAQRMELLGVGADWQNASARLKPSATVEWPSVQPSRFVRKICLGHGASHAEMAESRSQTWLRSRRGISTDIANRRELARVSFPSGAEAGRRRFSLPKIGIASQTEQPQRKMHARATLRLWRCAWSRHPKKAKLFACFGPVRELNISERRDSQSSC